VGEERVVLEHDADPALLGRDGAAGTRHDLSAQGDGARVGALEPGDEAQRGGLAAARRAEQREDLAFRHPEREVVHRGRIRRVEAFADPVEEQEIHG
jgi:hypothetical protein